jgi:AP-1-like factor
LETKVDDLQKASESANHENSILRAQVEKMSMELREYRKRVSLTTTNLNRTPSGGVPTYLTKGLATNGNTNLSDINFQFEFPKFGPLPASPPANGTSQSISPGTTAQKAASPVEKSQPSPLNLI